MAFEAAGLAPPSILDVWRKSERKVLEAKSLARRGDDDDEDDVDEGEEGDEAAAAEKPKACAWAHKMPPKFPRGRIQKVWRLQSWKCREATVENRSGGGRGAT